MTALAAVPDLPDSKQLATEAVAIVAQAQALQITDAASYAAAGEFGKGIRSLQKRITEFFSPHKKRAKAAHDALCADEKAQLAPTEQAVQIVTSKMLIFQREERARQEAEARRREEEARKLEEERRLQEAIELEEEGDVAAAEEVLDEPVYVPVVSVPQRPAPKVAGVATTKRWTLDPDATDIGAVIRHIVGVPLDQKLAHPELLNLVTLDTKVARQLMTAMRDSFHVPGIKAYEADGISLSAK